MSSHAMTRRQLLASGVSATTALLLSRFASAADTVTTTDIDTFYDPRFPVSQTLAGALPGASRLHTIQGDPTGLLAQITARGSAGAHKRLQGVTTETVPFCLDQIARRRHEVRFDIQRLDRALFAWSLELRPL